LILWRLPGFVKAWKNYFFGPKKSRRGTVNKKQKKRNGGSPGAFVNYAPGPSKKTYFKIALLNISGMIFHFAVVMEDTVISPEAAGLVSGP
jgi:hypothetical protein